MGDKPIVGHLQRGLEEPYRWKDSVQSAAEIRLWVADGVANGLRPWFTKFAGTAPRPTLARRRSRSSTAGYARRERVPAQRAAAGARGPGLLAADRLVLRRSSGEADGRGPRQRLVPGADRGPHPVRDGARPAARCRAPRRGSRRSSCRTSPRCRTTQCEQLRAFVKRGGGLVATYETSLYDEWGDRRKTSAWRTCSALTSAGATEGPMQNAYLRLEHDRRPAATRCCAGLEDAPRIIHGVSRVEVTPRAGFAAAPLTLIPSYPDLPMEKVYPRQSRDRRRRRCSCARSARAAWSISPGTSTGRSGRCWPSTTASCCATPCGGRPDEEPPVDGHGPRRARRDRLAAGATR